ncbi:MAG: hypothetical protein O6942_05255, partial [Bacteroidetes bacterium]|nr:hypothetical protein [Bacteroidota bacterium]
LKPIDTFRGVVAKLTPGTAIATPFSFDEPNPGAEAVATALNEVDDGTWRADRSRVVTELAVSSDDIVATADVSGSLILWDLESRSVLERLSEEENSTPDSLQFSPNGKWLAYYLSGVLHVIDVKDIASREKPPAAALKSNSPELIRNPADIPGLEIVEQIESFVPRIGLRVDVRSRGRWFPATIVGAYGSGLWQIHYDDSPDDWDEVVTNRRLRVRPAR